METQSAVLSSGSSVRSITGSKFSEEPHSPQAENLGDGCEVPFSTDLFGADGIDQGHESDADTTLETEDGGSCETDTDAITSRPPKSSDLMALLKRQGFRCAYTDEPLTVDNVSADHVVPACRNGGHGIENIALVTDRVNRAKSTMTLAEFVGICRKVTKKFEGKSFTEDDG